MTRFWDIRNLEGLETDPFLVEAMREDGLTRIRLPFGEGEAWLATRHEDVRFVTSDHRFSRAAAFERPDIPRMTPHVVAPVGAVLRADPPEHTRLRRAVTGAFSLRRVQRLRPRAEQILGRLLDEMAEPADLVGQVIRPFTTAMIGELIGVPEEDWPQVGAWGELMLSFGTDKVEAEHAKTELGRYFDELVARRRVDPREDLTTDLVHAHAEGKLDDDELRTMAEVLYISGVDAVRTQCANQFYVLLTHPGHLARLRSEPELLPRAIEEMLRFIPHRNGLGIPRIATEDVEVRGVLVSEGEVVHSSYLAANLDERVFADPERLDFDRHPNPHLAFGHGPHHCMASLLSRFEIEIMISTVLARFPNLRLTGDVTWLTGRLMRGRAALPVRW